MDSLFLNQMSSCTACCAKLRQNPFPHGEDQEYLVYAGNLEIRDSVFKKEYQIGYTGSFDLLRGVKNQIY